MIRASLPIVVVSALTSLSSAQIAPRVLVREGDPLPGSPGLFVTSLSQLAVNRAGGWAVAASSQSLMLAGPNLFLASQGITPWSIVREDGIEGGYEQTLGMFGSQFRMGLDDLGRIAYHARVRPTGSSSSLVDSFWREDVLLAHPTTGSSGLRGIGSTANGHPYWIEDGDVVIDTPGNVLLDVGSVPGFTSAATAIQAWLSPNGVHSIVSCSLSTLAIPSRVVIDGQLASVGGSVLAVSAAVPAAVGGQPGETWGSINSIAVSDDGRYAIGGQITFSGGRDYFVVVDGVLRYRSGDLIDGYPMSSSGRWPLVEFGPTGELVMIVSLDSSPFDSFEAIVYDGRIVVRMGDRVDLDGDDVAEPLSGISWMSTVNGEHGPLVGADGAIYCLAFVDIHGTVYTPDDRLALLRIPLPPIAYGEGKLNSLGRRPFVSTTGSPSVATNDLVLRIADGMPNSPGRGFFGPTRASTPFQGGTLYVGGPIVRMSPIVTDTSGATAYSIAIDASLVGTVRCYQFWQRDVLNPDGTGVGLTNGLEVRFHP